MHLTDRWRSAVAALGISLLAVGSLVTGVQAATFQVTFHATDTICVDGVSNRTDLTIELHDAHDVVVDPGEPSPIQTDSHGRFEGCFGMLVLPGLTLVASNPLDIDVVRFTIPPLSVHIDRVTDVVSGRSRANHALAIRISDCFVWADCTHVATRSVQTNSTGHYTKDLTRTFDLRGSDGVSVTYTSPQGHTFTVARRTPYFETMVGQKLVQGANNHGQSVTFRLKSSPGGSVLSTRTTTDDGVPGDYGVFMGAAMRAGRQLISDLAGDSRMTIPSTTTTFPIESGDQKIRTHCLANRRVTIDWSVDGHGYEVFRTADSQGRAVVNLSSAMHAGARLPHHTTVVIACETAGGDLIRRGVSS
jgi:hypothetical protein